jgi:methyl-accepting chemotaxis protein
MSKSPDRTPKRSFLPALSVKLKLILLSAGFIAAFAGTVFYTVRTLEAQKSEAATIDVFGRQRMLIQKYTKEILDEQADAMTVDSAVAVARATANQVNADRNYYAKNVVKKISAETEVEPSAEYHDHPGTIPGSVTFVQEVSDAMGASAGYSFRLRSEWNINPTAGLETEFHREASKALIADPETPYHRVVADGGTATVEYAIADMAGQGCVTCHNAHPDSPKTDFQVGDMMGILAVSIPIVDDPALTAYLTGETEPPSEPTRKLFELSAASILDGGVSYTDLAMTQEITVTGADNPEVRAKLGEVNDLWGELKTAVAGLAAAPINTLEYRTELGKVRTFNVAALKKMNQAVIQMTEIASDKVAAMMGRQWLILSVTVLLGGLLSFWIIRGIVRPLGLVSTRIGLLAEGVLDQETMDLGTNDEIGTLAAQYDRMLLNQRSIGQNVAAIAEGGRTVEFTAQSERDELAASLNAMIGQLRGAAIGIMLDQAPVGVLRADAELKISYMNEEAERAINVARPELGGAARELIGSPIEAFHSNAAFLRTKVSNSSSLPFTGEMEIGDEVIELQVTAIEDDGTFLGPMVCWSTITERKRIDELTGNTTRELIACSEELRASANELIQNAEETASVSEQTLKGAQGVTDGTHSVANAADEMSESITSVSKDALELSESVRTAVQAAGETDEMVRTLRQSNEEISRVSETIAQIADQTNLLALNATIEAANAGDAGLGFAVVAAEVKDLARETIAATASIDGQVRDINARSEEVAQAIEGIQLVIKQVEGLTGSVSSAVEEQVHTTSRITSSVSEVAGESERISAQMGDVTKAASSANNMAKGLLEAAEQLNSLSMALGRESH